MAKFHEETTNVFIEFIKIPQVQKYCVSGDVVTVRTKRHEIVHTEPPGHDIKILPHSEVSHCEK
jgi:hypothetical protein